MAPNSFKECASSVFISNKLHDAFQKQLRYKNHEITQKPISDGGDGFLEVCKSHYNLNIIDFPVTTPYNDEIIHAPVGISANRREAYIESAKVLGLNMIPAEHRAPNMLSSKGLGELLDALRQYIHNKEIPIKKVVIGIGGTGTNDLGLGAASVFGLELLSKRDKLDVMPGNYNKADEIVHPEIDLPFEIETVIDVVNPLLGANGASYQFATQKGASEDDIALMEHGFENILNLMDVEDVESLPGAGGGLAAGLKLFFNANTRTADQLIKSQLLVNSDEINPGIVITGEGKFDAQTDLNKGAKIIIDEFDDGKRKIFVICGSAENKSSYGDNTEFIELNDFFDTVEESINNIDLGLEKAVEKILMKINL